MNIFHSLLKNIVSVLGLQKCIFVFLIALGNAIFEAAGIAIIIPIINKNTNQIDKLYFDANQPLIIKLTLLLLTFYCLRFLFILWGTWKISEGVATVRVAASIRFLRQFLYNENNGSDTKRNIAGAYRNIIVEADVIASSFQALIHLTIELIIIISLLIVILYSQGKTVVIFLFIFSSTLVLYITFAKRISSGLGIKRQLYEGLRQQITYDVLNARNDLIKYSAEKSFLNKFKKSNANLALTWSKLNVLAQSPRSALEFLFVLSISLFSYFWLNIGASISQIIIFTLSVTLVFLRLLPSVNRAIASMQLLNFHRKTLEDFPQYIKNPIKPNDARRIKAIAFRNVRTQHSSIELNCRLEVGKIYGLAAPSGKGKSTLVDAIMRVNGEYTGAIEIDQGNGCERIDGYEFNIAYVPQVVGLVSGTIWDNITFSSKNEHAKHDFPSLDLDLSKVISGEGAEISGGERKRIGLLRAKYHEKNVFILDEVFVGNDENMKEKMLAILRELSKDSIILIISHDQYILKECDEVLNF